MRKMLVRETALALAAAVLVAGMLASCSMDVPDRNMPYSPYFKIEKRDGVYVACGIYEDRIPEDGKIVIPDGVELDDTWDIAYDKSDKRLGILKSSKVKSISVPAGVSSKTFSNIAGWALFVENIDIIYRGNLTDWCEHGYLSGGLYLAKSIQVDGGRIDPRMLEKITAEDIAGAKRIGDCAFYQCEKLTSVEIPDSVTEIGDLAFYSCGELATVTIGSNVTKIGKTAFSGCGGLTTVVIPDNVTEIGGSAFSGSGLTSVTIGNGVKEIGYWVFYECTSLTSVTIGSGVKEIGEYAFFNCWGLTTVEIPDSVTKIGDRAFHNCGRLMTVTIGKGVKEIRGFAFSDCDNLNTVTFAEPNDWYSVDSDDKEELVDFSDPENNVRILSMQKYWYTFVRKTE